MNKNSDGKPPHELKPDTLLTVGGRDPFAHHGYVNTPVYHASTLLYPSAEDYLAHRGHEVRCAVCLADSDQLVGMVSLTRIDHVHRHAEFNAVVGERAEQNRGIGTAATRAMVRHGFFDLNLHRIYVGILKRNVSSIRMCEKAGFRHEGTAREGAYKNGQYHDLVQMGILKSELPTEEGNR